MSKGQTPLEPLCRCLLHSSPGMLLQACFHESAQRYSVKTQRQDLVHFLELGFSNAYSANIPYQRTPNYLNKLISGLTFSTILLEKSQVLLSKPSQAKSSDL